MNLCVGGEEVKFSLYNVSKYIKVTKCSQLPAAYPLLFLDQTFIRLLSFHRPLNSTCPLRPDQAQKKQIMPSYQFLLGISWPQQDPFPIRNCWLFPASPANIPLISACLSFTLWKKNIFLLELEILTDF